MKGYGVSYGAVSVLNAIPCGIGSAIGIQLKVESFFEESDEVKIELMNRQELDDSLVSLCVRNTIKKLNLDIKGFRLIVRSEIPPSIGLKSSSAVCNAVILSVLDYYKVHWDPFDVIELGVQCAKECGVTITGAFDDACCSMFGGLVIADNNTDTMILQRTISEYDVIICLPDRCIQKADVDVKRYKEHRGWYRELASSIKKDFITVMKENGKYVSKIIGCAQPSELAIDPKVIATGISGTGPAVFLMTKKDKGKQIAEHLTCRTMITKTRSNILFDVKSIDGETDVPASKSITHRALFMAALSGKRCVIRNPLLSLDTCSTMEALKSMGATITYDRKELVVKADSLHVPRTTIDVGNSGTTLRFATALASTLDGITTITGDESLRNRTVEPLLKALGQMNAPNTGKPPVTLIGPIKTDRFEIDGSMSSQFISALLMIAPTFGRTVDIDVIGYRVSKPYVDMTVKMMRMFGITVEETGNGYRVKPGEYGSFDYTIPYDYSAATYPLVAGALGGRASVRGLDPKDIQGDRAILDILKNAGCDISFDGTKIVCERNVIEGMDIDMSNSPDLFPIVAVLMSTAKGKSKLYGAPHLKIKESNRIKTTVDMLNAIGADVVATDDGCIINGVPKLKGGKVEHKGDHRVMMAAAIASIISEGPVFMDDDGCWNVSFPGFPEMLHSLEKR